LKQKKGQREIMGSAFYMGQKTRFKAALGSFNEKKGARLKFN